MADEQISLESIMQRGRDRRPHGGEDPKRVAAPRTGDPDHLCYDGGRRAPRAAAIEKDGVLAEKPQVIRIEKS